jgi:hypothetical protein
LILGRDVLVGVRFGRDGAEEKMGWNLAAFNSVTKIGLDLALALEMEG